MTTDILLDINQKDFKYAESYTDKVFYSAEYGQHQIGSDTAQHLDVIIPSGYSVNLLMDEIFIKAPYIPSITALTVRFLRKSGSSYSTIQVNGNNSTQLFYTNAAGEIQSVNGCTLLGIDIDGLLKLKYCSDTENFEILSANDCDFELGVADKQAAELMMVCAPGKNYRYPVSGVGTKKYIGSIIDRTNVAGTILNELGDDGQGVRDVVYESDTQKMKVMTDEYNNKETVEIVDTSTLDVSSFEVKEG